MPDIADKFRTNVTLVDERVSMPNSRFLAPGYVVNADGSISVGTNILSIKKATTTQRANTTVLADDPELFITNIPAGSYQLGGFISIGTGANGGGFRFGLRAAVTDQAGAAMCNSWMSSADLLTTQTSAFYPGVTGTVINVQYAAPGNNSSGRLWLNGVVTFPAVDSLFFQWAQNAGGIASNTNVSLASCLTLTPLRV